MSTVYAKTPKGQSELESRAGGLKPKVRRVLIVIDGRRDLDEVTRLSASDEASATEAIRQLLLEGYIDIVGLPRPPGTLPEIASDTSAAPAVPPPAAVPIATPSKDSGPNQPTPDPFGGIIKI